MRILKRFIYQGGHVVSVLEFADTIEVECPPELDKEAVIRYLEEEGIMDELLGPDNDSKSKFTL